MKLKRFGWTILLVMPLVLNACCSVPPYSPAYWNDGELYRAITTATTMAITKEQTHLPSQVGQLEQCTQTLHVLPFIMLLLLMA